MKEIIVYSNHVHSFSRPVAAKYGVNAALVLGYISFRISVSKNERDGRFWYYDTLDSIAQHYPYIGRSAIYDAIQRLTQNGGPLIIGHFNKRKNDRTNWYALRDEDTAKDLKKKPLYFRIEDAFNYGIPAAVILNNLAYHINHKRKETPDFRLQALSASKLADILPFSRSTIQRALKRLVDAGILNWRTNTDTTQPTEYCFAHNEDLRGYLAGPNPNRPVLNEVPVNKGDYEFKPAQARIQQMGGSNPNKGGSKANEPGSNPNDVTILINPFENDCLEKTVWKGTSPVFDSALLFRNIHSSNRRRFNHSAIFSENGLRYN